MIIENASFYEVVKFINALELVDKEEMLKLLIFDIEATKKDDAIKANPNDPVMNFRRQLNKENQKLFDEFLISMDKIEEGYQLYKKQYNGMKDRIKRAREKIKELTEEDEKSGQRHSSLTYIEQSEIYYILKKFPQIDKAIDAYKVCRKKYASDFKNLINSRSDNNAHFPIAFKKLEDEFYNWFNMKSVAADAVRIANNNFKKMQESFDSDRKYRDMRKQMAIQAAERAAAKAAADALLPKQE